MKYSGVSPNSDLTKAPFQITTIGAKEDENYCHPWVQKFYPQHYHGGKIFLRHYDPGKEFLGYLYL